jgi:hypothetical protein
LNLGANHYILKSDDYRDQFSIIRKIIQNVVNKTPNAKIPIITQETASKFIHKLSHDVTGITHNIMGYATLLEEENNPDYVKGISRLLAKLGDRVKNAVSQVDDGSLNEE